MSGAGEGRLNCRVVLVRTEIAGNLGATARVMCNFGLRDLVLVAPVADPADLRARALATHGEAVLDRCRIVADLEEAVGDCAFVAATSARTGGIRRGQSAGSPAELLPRVAAAARTGTAALVFGPEPSGLTSDEVSRCHALIHIPTDPACPALNLAQAVAVCLYELRRNGATTAGVDAAAEIAPYAQQERMFEQLQSALEEIGYFYDARAATLMHGLRRLIGRAQPTATEVDWLFGLARQLRWVARNRPRRG